jgi:hypothetical protein
LHQIWLLSGSATCSGYSIFNEKEKTRFWVYFALYLKTYWVLAHKAGSKYYKENYL